MKLLIYSDLHLEFGTNFTTPESDADALILAGDITIFKENKLKLLSKFLNGWDKPVLYIAGNHEYYTKQSMLKGDKLFKEFLAANHPKVIFLQDESVIIGNVNFFGGTMWTDFNKGNPLDMMICQRTMNDYYLIKYKHSQQPLLPQHTINFHAAYKRDLIDWFKTPKDGKRVVISHHAPVIRACSEHVHSELQSAYNSLDMVDIIEEYQPDLWIYGHTHECDDQMIGKTRIVSNPRGYRTSSDNSSCKGFDINGINIVLGE